MLWSAFVGLAALSLIAPWQFQPARHDRGVALLAAWPAGLAVWANYALIRALDHAEASPVQPYGYTLLVWAALLGWLVFADIPGLWTILGAGVVVLSGVYAWTQDRKGA